MDFRVLQKDLRFAAGVAMRRPFNCLVQVTNRCNMKCSFCDFWPNPAHPSEELSTADFERLAQELSSLGTFLVSIEGGEPFARKDLVDVVRALSRQHITALFTNGWYLTEESARALWDAGLTHCSVSIDYADRARHDGKRGLVGTSERAWRAVEILKATAPRGGKQVHVMTVLMKDNQDQMRALFEETQRRGVGHQVTLLSVSGYRRGKSDDALPDPGRGEELARLWDQFPHVRFFREYFERIDAFLDQAPSLPTCSAGLQSFNIDHVGNVSPCIERIDQIAGNVKTESLVDIHRRLSAKNAEIAACQKCWTACRGFQQALGNGGNARNWLDLAARTRTQ
jgi:MoaA/NifB/PqqE/SkfB family radical SAM enzyme